MQLFTLADHERVARRELTVTYRLWKSSHVKKGASYPTGFGGGYHIVDVTTVKARDVTDEDAWMAGSPNRAELLKKVAFHTKGTITPSTSLFRVELRYLDEPPERDKLTVDEALVRLARLDNAARPWTKTALTLIELQPRVLARELAREAGFDTQPFKINIRKLKKIGLTLSHDIGYELTELGQAVLDELRKGRAAPPPTKNTAATKKAAATKMTPSPKPVPTPKKAPAPRKVSARGKTATRAKSSSSSSTAAAAVRKPRAGKKRKKQAPLPKRAPRHKNNALRP